VIDALHELHDRCHTQAHGPGSCSASGKPTASSVRCSKYFTGRTEYTCRHRRALVEVGILIIALELAGPLMKITSPPTHVWRQ
jgi:hypothetical protein